MLKIYLTYFRFITDLKSLPFESNFLAALQVEYDDYEVTEDRKNELRNKGSSLIYQWKYELLVYKDDPLTNETAYHLSDTIDQADCEHWFDIRELKITASKFKKFCHNILAILEVNNWFQLNDPLVKTFVKNQSFHHSSSSTEVYKSIIMCKLQIFDLII